MENLLVFEANDAIEAQLISDLLEHNHIETHVEGNYLQGGVGEIQAMGLIRIKVHPEDQAKARALIDDWLKQDIEAVDYPSHTKSGLPLFIAGVITGVIFTLMLV